MITGQIPLPGSGADAFTSGADFVQNIINSAQQNRLRQAEAAKSQMIAKLLGSITGGGAGMSGNANAANAAAALLGIPTHVVDGKMYNPLTGQSTQIGESPQEKSQRETSQAISTEQGKKNIAAGEKLQDAYYAAMQSKNYLKKLQSLLEKNPNLTGLGPGMLAKLRLSNDPNLAGFRSTAGLLQTQLAKLASSRGGIGVLKWAENIKPNELNNAKFNMGMIDIGNQNIDDEINNIRQEYKIKTGKDLPEFDTGENAIPQQEAVSSQQPAAESMQAPIEQTAQGEVDKEAPLTIQEIKDEAARIHKSVPETISLLAKAGYKIPKVMNAK